MQPSGTLFPMIKAICRCSPSRSGAKINYSAPLSLGRLASSQVGVGVNTRARNKERRRFSRVSLPGHLRYLKIPQPAAEYRNASVQDIGPGGFRIRTTELFHRKSCILFDLFIPGSDPIRCLATVAWTKTLPENGGYQIGGKFVEPNAGVETILGHLAAEH